MSPEPSIHLQNGTRQLHDCTPYPLTGGGLSAGREHPSDAPGGGSIGSYAEKWVTE